MNILKTVIDNNMGIEINTSGLRSRAKRTMADFDIVKRYKQLGGKILTIGSDAHVRDDVGADLDIALDMARAVGFEHLTVFKDMMPIFIKI